jgi:hypothetical protein
MPKMVKCNGVTKKGRQYKHKHSILVPVMKAVIPTFQALAYADVKKCLGPHKLPAQFF